MQNTTCSPRELGSLLTFRLCRILLLICIFASLSGNEYGQSKATSSSRATPTSASKASSQVAGPPEVNVSQTLIDESITDDRALVEMLQPYSARVRALDVVIGRLEGELRKGGIGGGSLGNFVTDGLRIEASRKLSKLILLTITNSGGMRKNAIAEGPLRVSDIFELLPFENMLIQIDLTGEQVLKLLQAILSDRDAQSGAHITYRLAEDNKPELVRATFVVGYGREKPINPKAIYSVVTNDYLYRLSSGRYAILREGKNVKPLGTTLRDALLHYVRSETASGRPIRAKLDGRFTQVGPNPTPPSQRQ